MLIFHEIISLNDRWLPEVQSLYESAFPLNERRLWKDLLQTLMQGNCKLVVFCSDNIFAGFVILWTLPKFKYIEHMAVVPKLRGLKLGEQVLLQLQQTSGRILLETELPEQSYSIRRVEFYERNGFVPAAYAYVQPPYRSGEQTTPMLLWSNFKITDLGTFKEITRVIRKFVYEPGWIENREP